jgi:hypothetical protein
MAKQALALSAVIRLKDAPLRNEESPALQRFFGRQRRFAIKLLPLVPEFALILEDH